MSAGEVGPPAKFLQTFTQLLRCGIQILCYMRQTEEEEEEVRDLRVKIQRTRRRERVVSHLEIFQDTPKLSDTEENIRSEQLLT